MPLSCLAKVIMAKASLKIKIYIGSKMPVLIVGPSSVGKSLITNILLAGTVDKEQIRVPATLADEPNGRRYTSEFHTSDQSPFSFIDTVDTCDGHSIYREVTYVLEKYQVPKVGAIILVLDFTEYYEDGEIESIMCQFEGIDLKSMGILVLTHYDDEMQETDYFERKETSRLPDCFFQRFRNVIVTDNLNEKYAERFLVTLSCHLSNCAWLYHAN